MTMFSKADQIISDLMNALDLIRRESTKHDANRYYINGVAMGAMANCDAQREPNRDGYLVMKPQAVR